MLQRKSYPCRKSRKLHQRIVCGIISGGCTDMGDLSMLMLLLEDNGDRAANIKRSYTSTFGSKKEYFEYPDDVFSSGDRIVYTDAEAKVKL